MKLICTDCGIEGKQPFKDSAPYAEGSPHGQCATHGPTKAPAMDTFTRPFARDFRRAETFTQLRSPRFVGMEFEMYHRSGVTNRVLDLSRDWRLLHCGVSEDGSISSRANIELKTPPAQGDDALLWAQAIGSICPSYGMVVNKSCGLHVHVDIRDYSAGSLKRLGLLAMAVEPVLYAALPRERRDNGMAGPARLERQRLMRTPADFDHLRNLWQEQGNGRHIGLNIFARDRHGTVEFRYHSGTLNADKVRHWLRVCTGMVDAAAAGEITTHALGKAPGAFEDRVKLLQASAKLPDDTMAYLHRRIKHFGHDVAAMHQAGEEACSSPPIMDLEMPSDWPFHGTRMGDTYYCRFHLMYEPAGGGHCAMTSGNYFQGYPMPADNVWPGLGKWMLMGRVGLSISNVFWVYLCPEHRMVENAGVGPVCGNIGHTSSRMYNRVLSHRSS